MNWHDGLAFA